MRVFIAPERGFCFGVRRSIDMANKVAKEVNIPVYTYGPIIHNPQVVERLREQGVVPIELLEGVRSGKLIIRSHGVSIDIIRKAKRLGFSVVDATCPFVKRAQKYARKLHTEGYKIIIIGESEHPEVQGILGNVNNQAEVISELTDLKVTHKRQKIGVIAQTTISSQKFKEVVAALLINTEEVRVYNTICKDVISRQHHAIELAKKVEIMLVVGGKNSANTRRLVELASCYCNTHHIETEKEVDRKWFKDKTVVGVASGASTPNWIIDEVVKKIEVIG